MSSILLNEEQLESLLATAAIKRFKEKLEGYASPLDGIITDAFKINEPAIRKAVYEATTNTVNSDAFTKSLTDALNHKLANLVINKCSGLVEKSFQTLMQDQVLRNKLQSAVIAIIEGKNEDA